MKLNKFLSVILTVFILSMSLSISAAASAVKGDANGDGALTVRDAAYIAVCLSKGQALDDICDYNGDGKVNIRDASAIASALVTPYAAYAKEMLKLVNEERAKVGVSPVVLNLMLTSAANVRAEEISESFSHTRPDGTAFSTVFKELGINYYCCGENIAAGISNAEDVVEMWVNSPAHYENIIDVNFTQLGVGYYYDSKSVFKHHWVQLFKCD